MTRQFTVRIEGMDAQTALHRQVLASLPEHFRMVSDSKSDAVLWSGTGNSPTGAAVVVLAESSDPVACDDGTLIVAAPRYAPRLAADAGIVRARASAFKLVNIVATTGMAAGEVVDLTAYLDLCACLRLLSAARPRMAAFTRTAKCLAATLTLENKPTVVSLTVARSPAFPEMTLDAVGDTVRLHARLDAGAIARPGLVEVNDAIGCRRAPGVFQNDHRLTWLSVHAVLSGGQPRWLYGQAERNEDVAELQRAMTGGAG